MILLLFGPPGCGKGTQGAFLADRFGIPEISTGEMFRAECEAGTRLGKWVCTILKSGRLVPDGITDQVVGNRIARPDCANGFLLDGYPRTIEQARSFGALLAARGLPEPAVLYLDVDAGQLVTRLAARRQCLRCHHIYNLLTQPPVIACRCDIDGGELTVRDDDREEVVRERLHAYNERSRPILDWYGEGRVHRVDGNRTPLEVARAVEEAVMQYAGLAMA